MERDISFPLDAQSLMPPPLRATSLLTLLEQRQHGVERVAL